MDKDYFLKRIGFNFKSNFEKYSYDLLPQSFRSDTAVDLECFKHGLFQQTPAKHLKGEQCPHCEDPSDRIKYILTTSDFIAKSRKKYGNRFSYEKTEYVRRDLPVIVTCRQHGDIAITPYHHAWSKHGCAQCDTDVPKHCKMLRAIENAKKIHGDKYDYSRITDFSNMNIKGEIVCPVHGSFWQVLFLHFIKGNTCPHCSHENDRLTLADFVTKSRAVHGDAYNYDKVKYETNTSMVTITCLKHGDFIQRAASHLAGCKCKKCHVEEKTLSKDKFVEMAKEIHGDRYDYSKVAYLGNKKKVEIVCPVHGSFWQKPNGHVSSKMGCRLCSESKGERAVEIALKKYGIDYVREYRIEPHLYRYDFYLPKLDVYVEFHGQQHYGPVEIFGGEEGFLATKKRDEYKKLLVSASGGRLIVLNYLTVKENAVERELVRKLKKTHSKWYVIDGRLKAYKTPSHVCVEFGIPASVKLSELDNEVKKRVKDFALAF